MYMTPGALMAENAKG